MTLYSAMKRKSERERVATLFQDTAKRVGAECIRDRYEIEGPREVSLHITLDGCTVNVDFDADIPLGAFLGHWFFADRRGRLFAAGFDGHGYRPHHKATSMCEHAEDLCAHIEDRLLRIKDGTAFVIESAA